MDGRVGRICMPGGGLQGGKKVQKILEGSVYSHAVYEKLGR